MRSSAGPRSRVAHPDHRELESRRCYRIVQRPQARHDTNVHTAATKLVQAIIDHENGHRHNRLAADKVSSAGIDEFEAFGRELIAEHSSRPHAVEPLALERHDCGTRSQETLDVGA